MPFQNSINANQQGTQYLSSVGVWSGLDGGASTQVLTSNGTGVAPSFQALPASSITIAGDTGSISGSSLTIYALNSTEESGSSVLFSNSGTTSTFKLTDARFNTMLGKNCGNSTLSSGVGGGHTAVGNAALKSLVNTSGGNSAFGQGALALLTTGQGNVAIGSSALGNLITGSLNHAFGNGAGLNYVGAESSNLLFRHSGFLGESNVIRIGQQGSSSGEQDECFIAGIIGVTTSNTQMVTIDSSTTQLGVVAPGQIPGTTTNDNASAGNVGEYISASKGAGATVALTSTVTADVLSISLTAGDWDVSGNVLFSLAAGTTVTAQQGGISLTSATLPAGGLSNDRSGFSGMTATADYASQQTLGVVRVSIASTTTVYLVARAEFAVSTMDAYGFIGARRAR